jgi:hypothetical protein
MPPHYRKGLMPRLPPTKALALTMALASALLVSCGPSPNAGGGIGGTGSVSVSSVSSGVVTKLGSVSVSGTEYDNSTALYCIDLEPCSTENRLKVGMVVRVNGTTQSRPDGSLPRVADIITFKETLEGVVQSVAPDGSGLVVLGQLVDVHPKTVIDEGIPGGSVRNLKPGLDIIVVSGLVSGDGHIHATLITTRTRSSHYEVQGVIKNHDAAAKRFEIGQLLVEYSSADVSDITADGTMNWNNNLVHVRADEWQPRREVPHGATLLATVVRRLGLRTEDGADAKLEGFITYVSQSGTFTINNHPIIVSSATMFEGGTANDLILGTHLLIEGVLVQGKLNAYKVVFKENLELESNVELMDLQARSLTLAAFPGLSIEIDAGTLIEDGATTSRFEDIRIGDHLKIHGKLLDSQRLVATELERTEPSVAIILEAPLQSTGDPHMLLASVNIDTSEILENEFMGSHGPIGRKKFFEKAVIGRRVWAKGTLTGSIVAWSTVRIKG